MRIEKGSSACIRVRLDDFKYSEKGFVLPSNFKRIPVKGDEVLGYLVGRLSSLICLTVALP